MRYEINEPHHWRSHLPREAKLAERGKRQQVGAKAVAVLPAELVDAALAEDELSPQPQSDTRNDTGDSRRQIVRSISTQLAMLESQRRQLQRLLAEAQDG